MLPVIRAAYNRVEAAYAAPLAVEVLPLERFYAAEEYHQDYLDKHPAGYCHIPQSLIEAAKKI
jgi:peptide methionine sulfoxide reductase msrA/msrB